MIFLQMDLFLRKLSSSSRPYEELVSLICQEVSNTYHIVYGAELPTSSQIRITQKVAQIFYAKSRLDEVAHSANHLHPNFSYDKNRGALTHLAHVPIVICKSHIGGAEKTTVFYNNTVGQSPTQYSAPGACHSLDQLAPTFQAHTANAALRSTTSFLQSCAAINAHNYLVSLGIPSDSVLGGILTDTAKTGQFLQMLKNDNSITPALLQPIISMPGGNAIASNARSLLGPLFPQLNSLQALPLNNLQTSDGKPCVMLRELFPLIVGAASSGGILYGHPVLGHSCAINAISFIQEGDQMRCQEFYTDPLNLLPSSQFEVSLIPPNTLIEDSPSLNNQILIIPRTSPNANACPVSLAQYIQKRYVQDSAKKAAVHYTWGKNPDGTTVIHLDTQNRERYKEQLARSQGKGDAFSNAVEHAQEITPASVRAKSAARLPQTRPRKQISKAACCCPSTKRRVAKG